MKAFEVKETLIIDEDTNDVSVWIVKDVHSGKTVFFVKDNEVIIANEDYIKTLTGIMKMSFVDEKENNDPCARCNGENWYDDCPFA